MFENWTTNLWTHVIMAHHGTFIDHLTHVIFKHQLYDEMWQLKPTYF
jgi:hypothetical protein